jgi:hypothetical protein
LGLVILFGRFFFRRFFLGGLFVTISDVSLEDFTRVEVA